MGDPRRNLYITGTANHNSKIVLSGFYPTDSPTRDECNGPEENRTPDLHVVNVTSYHSTTSPDNHNSTAIPSYATWLFLNTDFASSRSSFGSLYLALI